MISGSDDAVPGGTSTGLYISNTDHIGQVARLGSMLNLHWAWAKPYLLDIPIRSEFKCELAF